MSEPGAAPQVREASQAYLYFVSMAAAVGAFLFGYDLSIITGAMLYLEKVFPDSNLGILVGSATAGCIVGALMATYMADAIGRRTSLFVSVIFFIVSSIWTALANDPIGFTIARAIGGIGVGLATGISPMFIAEVSPPKMRGRMVTVNQLSIVVGIVASVVVAWWLARGEEANATSHAWRWMFASALVPSLALLVGLFFVPESPRWMAARGHDAKALATFARINGSERAAEELKEVKAELTHEEGTFSELFTPGVFRALVLGCILMIFQQINGVNMILIYGAKILSDAKIGAVSDALFMTIFVNGLILLCTIVSFALVSKFPRRKIMMGGITGMAIGHGIMAYTFITHSSAYLALVAQFVAAGSFTLTFAPVAWIVLSEMFPNRVRGKCMGVVTFFLFTSSTVCTWAFPNITKASAKFLQTEGWAYVFFGGICMMAVAFIWKFIPETKDLTLEQISDFWLSGRYKQGGAVGDSSQKASS